MNNQDTIVWIHITSGSGPEECCLAVSNILKQIQQDTDLEGVKITCLEAIPSDKGGNFKSVLLSLQGEGARNVAACWEGQIKWMCPTPYRPGHKRKNWFVGVNIFFPPPEPIWNELDIQIQTCKSSGPGGQHVNKSETAVRITHIPTGLTAEAREERSQALNKKLALARLCARLDEKKKNHRDRVRKELWEDHKSLERGNPDRIYKGKDFILVQRGSIPKSKEPLCNN